MKYYEKKELKQRGAFSQEAPETVRGTLLKGEHCVAQWHEPKNYGGDDCWLSPAFLDGERCWILKRRWVPDRGYSAEGTEEIVLPFEHGIKLLIEKCPVWDEIFTVDSEDSE